jgi:glycosidase
MRVHDDYAEGWNVAQQLEDQDSPFKFWQKMLALRKEYEALIYGMSPAHLSE